MKLLSSDGIPHQQIVAGLPARSNDDCLDAFAYFEKSGMLDRDVAQAIGTMADQLRDAAEVLKRIEPRIRARLTEIGIPDDVQARTLEVHALMVEAYVRAANAVFPIPGKN